MAKFFRMEVLQAIMDSGLVPLFFNADVDTAAGLADACAKGGARVVEFTNRGEGAVPVFAGLVAHSAKTNPNLILGVGSVLDAPTAALFLAHGANFIVSPIFNQEVARLCNMRKVAYLPGAATATEITTAEEWGVEIVKLFPGQTLGPEFIKAVLGPCPWHRLMPTGGVDSTTEGVSSWIKAGAVAVGMGSSLISKSLMQEKKYDELTAKVSQVLDWVRQARTGG